MGVGRWPRSTDRCQTASQYIQTHRNIPGSIWFICHFSKNKGITVLAVKFHDDLHPMFKKLSNDANGKHLFSTCHVPGPMLKTVHVLLNLILTTAL